MLYKYTTLCLQSIKLRLKSRSLNKKIKTLETEK